MWKKMILFCLSMLLLGGCSRKELEDKEFVMAMEIDWDETYSTTYVFPDYAKVSEEVEDGNARKSFTAVTENLYQAEEQYGSQSDKTLDFNHIKAIVINKEICMQEARTEQLVSYLEDNSEIGRNTVVFFTNQENRELLKQDYILEQSVGYFLENMYENSENLVKEQAVTVSDFIAGWYNKGETLLLPVLEKGKETPVISSYEVVKGGISRGGLSIEEAAVICLARGIKVPVFFSLEEEVLVQTVSITPEYQIVQEERIPVVSLNLKGKITPENKVIKNYEERLKIDEMCEKQIAEKLNYVLNKFKNEKKLDLLNTYVLLGSRNRELLEQYWNRQEAYEETLFYRINCKLKCI